ncbi:cyclic nucleotide-binding domain-containing protein [Cyclospora cayetanensis]|uniref:Cyclic nucleotide-binding domain-containing protein n=1 Tax=Cyclospora cayetanensis TaxID=88456 RepID=A0A1D3CSW5_9EIME|nr:cyclic nucleotide-binding domain-containing protein [Cyclospora cayetanensis]
MSAPEYEEYIQAKLTPVLESLVTEVLLAHPEDPVTFMISRLCQRAKLPDPTTPYSKENEELRQELARLREDKVLGLSFMFSCLDNKDRNTVVDAMKERQIPADMTLIKQGADGDCLYIVETGSLQCWREDGGRETMVKVVGPGDVFGELALLYNAPRAATVKSAEDCKLWRLDRDTFNAIVKDAATKKREMYDAFLSKVFVDLIKSAAVHVQNLLVQFKFEVRLLESMSTYDRIKLADALRTEEYQGGEFIVRQGEPGDIFYLIEEGSAIAMKVFEGQTEPQEVETYKAGDYFGELALLTGEPRAASVIAKGSCKVATLDRKSFKRLMGSVEEILKRKAQEYKKQPQ